MTLVEPGQALLPASHAIAVLTGIAVAVQLAYWLMLRRYFRKGDLV